MSDLAVIGPHGREPRSRPLLRTTLGNVLRRQRLAQKRTLAEVARAAKVSLPYLSEVERGRKEASSEVLAAVCEALRLELSDVLTEAGRDLAQRRDSTGRRELGAGRSTVTELSQARRRAPSLRFGAGDVLCRAA
jgi:transcriptional regulator with XRE-family HTH domain